MLTLTRTALLLRRVAGAFAIIFTRTRNTPADELDGFEAWLDESFAR